MKRKGTTSIIWEEEEEETKDSKVEALTPLVELRKDLFKEKIVLIGVTGGSASGKTTVCDLIRKSFDNEAEVEVLSQDSYYRSLNEDHHLSAQEGKYNFDHPNAIDNSLLAEQLRQIKKGEKEFVMTPSYDFVSHQQIKDAKKLDLQKIRILLVEGFLLFCEKEVRDLFDLKIFVDTDDDLRLVRRIKRDRKYRGLDVDVILDQYTTYVKPCFDNFIVPTRRHCDVIIPWSKGGVERNDVAVQLVVDFLRFKTFN